MNDSFRSWLVAQIDPNRYGYDEMAAYYAFQEALAEYDKHLEQAPKVFCNSQGFLCSDAEVDAGGYKKSHTARLVCFEEIKK